jgi:hypothetical protein
MEEVMVCVIKLIMKDLLSLMVDFPSLLVRPIGPVYSIHPLSSILAFTVERVSEAKGKTCFVILGKNIIKKYPHFLVPFRSILFVSILIIITANVVKIVKILNFSGKNNVSIIFLDSNQLIMKPPQALRINKVEALTFM